MQCSHAYTYMARCHSCLGSEEPQTVWLTLIQSIQVPLSIMTAVLMQAHMARLPAPISDYVTDTKSVLDQSLRVLQAMTDVSADAGWLDTALVTMMLVQSLMQVHSHLPPPPRELASPNPISLQTPLGCCHSIHLCIAIVSALVPVAAWISVCSSATFWLWPVRMSPPLSVPLPRPPARVNSTLSRYVQAKSRANRNVSALDPV